MRCASLHTFTSATESREGFIVCRTALKKHENAVETSCFSLFQCSCMYSSERPLDIFAGYSVCLDLTKPILPHTQTTLAQIKLALKGNLLYKTILARSLSLQIIKEIFNPRFQSDSMLVATWDRVKGHKSTRQAVNSFQTLIATDSDGSGDTYVCNFYHELGWAAPNGRSGQ